MKQPSYKLESIDDIRETYDYHESLRPKKEFTQNAYRLINYIVAPEITYEPGSRDRLNELNETRAPQIYAINHLSNLHDQWTAAAIGHQIAPELVGDIRVLAKDGFYNGELMDQFDVSPRLRKFAQPLLTRFVNQMGAIPVSRAKNHEHNRALALQSSRYMMDMLGRLIEAGNPVAGYFESTHNYRNPEVNLEIKAGIGHLAMRSLQEGRMPASIVPIGVSYGRDYKEIGEGLAKPNKIRHPQVHIGTISTVEKGNTVNNIVRRTAHNLQNATTQAFKDYDNRSN